MSDSLLLDILRAVGHYLEGKAETRQVTIRVRALGLLVEAQCEDRRFAHLIAYGTLAHMAPDDVYAVIDHVIKQVEA